MKKIKKIKTTDHFESSIKIVSGDFILRKKLQTIIEALPVSLVVFDRELRFITASDRFFENSPLKKKKVKVNDHWYDLIPDMPRKWKIIHKRCLKGERLKCDEDAFYREDGSVEWWRWEVVPFLEEDKTVGGLILFAENITHQKVTEKNLRHMVQLLHDSNHNLSTFAHECAHDLFAPLRTLSNYIYLLQETLTKNITQARAYALQIKKSAAYMADLIKKTLDATDASNCGLKPSWFSLNQLIEGLTIILKEDIDKKNATLTVSSSIKIYADHLLICQVFQNLIINALHYCAHSHLQVKIDVEETEDFWVIHVSDNGPGIKEDALEHIFEAYQRGASSEHTAGLGLGLYKCKKIIAAHDGTMWVQSKNQKGTTFSFSIHKPKH